MSLPNVKKGQTIGATAQNALINTVNALDVKQTAIDNMLIRGGGNPASLVPAEFSIKCINSRELSARQPIQKSDSLNEQLWIFLGTEESMHSCIPKFYIQPNDAEYETYATVGGTTEDFAEYCPIAEGEQYLLIPDDENDLGGSITGKDMIKANGEGIYYDGWVNTTYGKSSTVYAYVIRLVENETDDNGNTVVDKTMFCITETDDEDDIHDYLAQYIPINDESQHLEFPYHIILSKLTEAGTMPDDPDGEKGDFRHRCQCHVGQITIDPELGWPGFLNKAMLSGDSNLSATENGIANFSVDRHIFEGDPDDEEDDKDAFTLYGFPDCTNKVQAEQILKSEDTKHSEVLVRQATGESVEDQHTLVYADLSSFIEFPDANTTDWKSVQRKANGKVTKLQMYKFDENNTDLTGRVMTLGSIEETRAGKIGKLVDANGNVLTGYDIVVRDQGNKEIKYMSLSVDETYVDAYATGTTGKSIQTTNINSQEALRLYNFMTQPSDTLKADVGSNGTYDFKMANNAVPWVLVKYLDNQNHMVLDYKKLQISTDLSSGGTTGYTGTLSAGTSLKWNSDGNYQIELWGVDLTYQNGVLKNVGAERKLTGINTTPWTGE